MNIPICIMLGYFYTKYNYYCHCYEVSKDTPVRYFDGKIWRMMKAPNSKSQFVSRRPKQTIDLDLSSSQTNENLSGEEISNDSATNEDTEVTTKKITTKTRKKISSTTKKITTKTTKIIMTKTTKKGVVTKTVKKGVDRFPKKITTNQCTQCNLRKQTNKVTPSRITKKLGGQRPTIKTTLVRSKKAYPTKTAKKSLAIATKKTAVKSTKKLNPAKTSTRPLAKTTRKISTQVVPENWQIILRGLVNSLKALEAKQENCTQCAKPHVYNPTTEYLLTDGRRDYETKNRNDDTLSILSDGIELDKRSDEASESTSEHKIVLKLKKIVDGKRMRVNLNSLESVIGLKDVDSEYYSTINPRHRRKNKVRSLRSRLEAYLNRIKAKHAAKKKPKRYDRNLKADTSVIKDIVYDSDTIEPDRMDGKKYKVTSHDEDITYDKMKSTEIEYTTKDEDVVQDEYLSQNNDVKIKEEDETVKDEDDKEITVEDTNLIKSKDIEEDTFMNTTQIKTVESITTKYEDTLEYKDVAEIKDPTDDSEVQKGRESVENSKILENEEAREVKFKYILDDRESEDTQDVTEIKNESKEKVSIGE